MVLRRHGHRSLDIQIFICLHSKMSEELADLSVSEYSSTSQTGYNTQTANARLNPEERRQ